MSTGQGAEDSNCASYVKQLHCEHRTCGHHCSSAVRELFIFVVCLFVFLDTAETQYNQTITKAHEVHFCHK